MEARSSTSRSWAIYYGDGSVYSSEDGSHWDAPARNVQVIVVADPDHKWTTVSSTDYYILWDDRWQGVDWFGLYDYLCEPGPRKVLFGRTLTQVEWDALLGRVWKEWGEKDAWRKGERK